MILKVKEPLPEEYDLFHQGQVLFTYLHLPTRRWRPTAACRC